MDPEAIQQKIQERLDQLPESVRDAIMSEDTGARIRDIATRNKLHIDQASALEDLTTLVMLGFVPTEDFSVEVQRKLLVEKTAADSIIGDIESEIFVPIRERMQAAGEHPPKEGAPANPVPAMPSPPPPKVEAPILPQVEQALTQTTATVIPPQTQQQPAQAQKPIYKIDPYREPPE